MIKFSTSSLIGHSYSITLCKLFSSYPFNQHQFSSVAQLCPTLCDPMNHSMSGLPVHHKLPKLSNSCPSSWWCHPAISSSVVPSSSYPQSLPASRSFPTSQLFTWDGQSIVVSASASVLPMNTQDLSPSGQTIPIPLITIILNHNICILFSLWLCLWIYISLVYILSIFGEGNGNPFQYSCLENPMDWEAW